MGTTMLVQPSGMTGGGGFGFGDGNGWWILLLFILMGGWDNGMGGFGGGDLYPWMNNSQNINSGFRDQMLNTSISGIQNSITSGFGDVQTALCGGFAGTTAAVTGAQNAIAQQLYTNQIADLERSFAAQTASTAGMTTILDKMCQQEIDNLKAQNLALQNQVNLQAMAASQAAQTAALVADNTAQTQYIVNRVAPYPIPAYTVANPVTPATA